MEVNIVEKKYLTRFFPYFSPFVYRLCLMKQHMRFMKQEAVLAAVQEKKLKSVNCWNFTGFYPGQCWSRVSYLYPTPTQQTLPVLDSASTPADTDSTTVRKGASPESRVTYPTHYLKTDLPYLKRKASSRSPSWLRTPCFATRWSNSSVKSSDGDVTTVWSVSWRHHCCHRGNLCWGLWLLSLSFTQVPIMSLRPTRRSCWINAVTCLAAHDKIANS